MFASVLQDRKFHSVRGVETIFLFRCFGRQFLSEESPKTSESGIGFFTRQRVSKMASDRIGLIGGIFRVQNTV